MNSIKDFDNVFQTNENLNDLYSILYKSSNYCHNQCLEVSNLKEFKTCFLTCQNFRNKKMEYVNNYLDQIECIIQGEEMPQVPASAYQNSYSDDIKQINKKSHLVNKYVFKDFYYQSSSTHDVGTPNKPKEQQYLGKKVNG